MVTAAAIVDMIMRGCVAVAALSVAGSAANYVKAYNRRTGGER